MNVVFEEQAPTVRAVLPSRGIVGWMLRNHIATSASRAQTVLLVVAIAIFVISAFVGTSALSRDAIDPRKNFVPAVVR